VLDAIHVSQLKHLPLFNHSRLHYHPAADTQIESHHQASGILTKSGSYTPNNSNQLVFMSQRTLNKICQKYLQMQDKFTLGT
jgi:hypothetical protein